MTNVTINQQVRLSEHFKLGELCKTSVQTEDGRSATQGDALLAKNIPSRMHIENLKRLCQWLEMLREEWNQRYGEGDDPVIITSGYRSPEVNKRVGGSPTSNHLTGCAVDIRVSGIEQAVRYATILLDISDAMRQDFDELLIERNKAGRYWVHLAVRPPEELNRRKLLFIAA